MSILHRTHNSKTRKSPHSLYFCHFNLITRLDCHQFQQFAITFVSAIFIDVTDSDNNYLSNALRNEYEKNLQSDTVDIFHFHPFFQRESTPLESFYPGKLDASGSKKIVEILLSFFFFTPPAVPFVKTLSILNHTDFSVF